MQARTGDIKLWFVGDGNSKVFLLRPHNNQEHFGWRCFANDVSLELEEVTARVGSSWEVIIGNKFHIQATLYVRDGRHSTGGIHCY